MGRHTEQPRIDAQRFDRRHRRMHRSRPNRLNNRYRLNRRCSWLVYRCNHRRHGSHWINRLRWLTHRRRDRLSLLITLPRFAARRHDRRRRHFLRCRWRRGNGDGLSQRWSALRRNSTRGDLIGRRLDRRDCLLLHLFRRNGRRLRLRSSRFDAVNRKRLDDRIRNRSDLDSSRRRRRWRRRFRGLDRWQAEQPRIDAQRRKRLRLRIGGKAARNYARQTATNKQREWFAPYRRIHPETSVRIDTDRGLPPQRGSPWSQW